MLIANRYVQLTKNHNAKFVDFKNLEMWISNSYQIIVRGSYRLFFYYL